MGVFTKIREHDKKGFLSHGSYPQLLLIASLLLYHLVTAKAASTEAASPNYRKWRSVQDALFKVWVQTKFTRVTLAQPGMSSAETARETVRFLRPKGENSWWHSAGQGREQPFRESGRRRPKESWARSSPRRPRKERFVYCWVPGIFRFCYRRRVVLKHFGYNMVQPQE